MNSRAVDSSPAGPGAPAAAVDAAPREAAAQFAGLLIQEAFRPLAGALGFYGDVVVASVAQSLARAEAGPLTGALARVIAEGGP